MLKPERFVADRRLSYARDDQPRHFSVRSVPNQADMSTVTRGDGDELPPEALHRLKITIPGYELLGEVARGGQAVVYRARESSLQNPSASSLSKTVAIKLLLAGQLADEAARSRLQREACVLSSLKHENIVTFIKFGRTDEGYDYLVMDYIDGERLDRLYPDFQKLDCRSFDSSFLLNLFLKICDAMNAAHRAGVTHRDLSPSNILIDKRNEPYLLDFGLARTAFDRFFQIGPRSPSVPGEFVGKIAYASPEQAGRNPELIDVRTDVYALGIILYQILTGGQFPYVVEGDPWHVLSNIANVKPTPPSELMEIITASQATRNRLFRKSQPPLVNATIEAIVLKALEKRPEDRYQSAGALADDIRNYLCGKPTVAIPKIELRTYLPAALGMYAAAIAAFVFPLLALWLGLTYFGGRLLPSTRSTVSPQDPPQNGTDPQGVQALRSLVVQAESTPDTVSRFRLGHEARKLMSPLVCDLNQSNVEIWDLAARTARVLQDDELAILADEALTRLRPDSTALKQLAPSVDAEGLRNWTAHRPEFLRLAKHAASGDRAAIGQLGLAYQMGSNGFPQDDGEALRWSRIGANAGDGLAMCNLGVMSLEGRARHGISKNVNEALRWFRAGAQAGDGRAMSFLGTIDADVVGGNRGDDRAAIKWFRKGAAAGNGRAMSCLGAMSDGGRGGLNPAQAVSWYRKAAAAGDADGMFHLGQVYLRGRSSEFAQDSSEAIHWLRKAAEAGAVDAMRALGEIYDRGAPGLRKAPSEATRWYRRAARREDLLSQVWLQERHLAW